MSLHSLRRFFVLFFAIGQIVTTALLSTAFNEVSDSARSGSPVYFLPAGYTFAIWGMIMVLSLVYAVYQLLPKQADHASHRRIGSFVMVNTMFFSIWVALAVQSGSCTSSTFQPLWILATVAVITGMLVMNIFAFLNLRDLSATLSRTDRWLAVVPVSVYFGWLSVATIANTTSYLYGAGWTGTQYGALITVALLIVALVITGFVILLYNITEGTVAYGAVVTWAALGIAAANVGQSLLVTITAGVVAILILLLTMLSVSREHFPPASSQTPQTMVHT
ncbi:MAG: hypothetical protein AAGF95_30395 [Chloroflexota bacterium]